MGNMTDFKQTIRILLEVLNKTKWLLILFLILDLSLGFWWAVLITNVLGFCLPAHLKNKLTGLGEQQ